MPNIIIPTASQQQKLYSKSSSKNQVIQDQPEPKQVFDGRDGRDGLQGAQGLKGEKGNDGISPDINEIVAQLHHGDDGMQGERGNDGDHGKDGDAGKDGKDGKCGKDGKSITKVEINKNNTLFVFIDGVKRKVGQINVPREFVGGGGGMSGVYSRKGSVIFDANYVSGQTVEGNTLVNDDGWLMNSNRKTDEPAAVSSVGSEFNVYDGTLNEVNVLAKQVFIGTRYTSVDFASINGYRIDTVVGYDYIVYLVKDPLGEKIISELLTFTGVIKGFQSFNTTPVTIGPNETFDLVVLINEPNPTPTITVLNYDYNTPNGERDPNDGEIVHANRLTTSLYISKIDDDGADQSAFLATLGIGDAITGQNVKWLVQSVTDNGSFYNFDVAPSTQDAPDGVYGFSFETAIQTPINYGEDLSYWAGSAIGQGLYIADGNYSDIVPDDTGRGADMIVQKIAKSDDWDVVMPASTSAGSGTLSNVRLESIGRFDTVADQNIPGLGAANLIRLHYGVGGVTPGGEFNIVSDGTVACNTAGVQYRFGFVFRLSRDGAAGESLILLRLMYAADGVTNNAIQILNTFLVQIDNPITIWREAFDFDFEPAQGSLMWVEAARDPAGNDSGDISTLQPTGDVAGWNPSKSAVLTINRYVTG